MGHPPECANELCARAPRAVCMECTPPAKARPLSAGWASPETSVLLQKVQSQLTSDCSLCMCTYLLKKNKH